MKKGGLVQLLVLEIHSSRSTLVEAGNDHAFDHLGARKQRHRVHAHDGVSPLKAIMTQLVPQSNPVTSQRTPPFSTVSS